MAKKNGVAKKVKAAKKEAPKRKSVKKEVKEMVDQSVKEIASASQSHDEVSPVVEVIGFGTSPTQSEAPLTLSTADTISTVSVSRESLLNGLKVARDFSGGRKNTMPILSNCLLAVKKDEIGRWFITLAATDLEASWKATYPCEATAEISQAVPLETFYSELKALTEDIKDAELTFKQGAIRVNGRCDIYTMPGEDYPQIPEVEGSSVKVSLTALRAVLPAVGQNDARYVLNGALFDFDKGIVVGTDGHRLHLDNIEKQEHGRIIIPRRVAELMSKHGGNEITLLVKGSSFSGKLADGDMTGRLIDGNFPNYEQVIPKSAPITVEFSAKDMMKVFEGCLPILNEKSHAIALLVNGKIEVQAVSSDRGVYKWHVAGNISGKGPEEIKFGFNVNYLQDAFRSYAAEEGATVTMQLSDPLSPSLINGKAVVMPMRV